MNKRGMGMRYGKMAVVLLTVVLMLLMICVTVLGTSPGESCEPEFRIQSHGYSQNIRCWKNDGKYHVFLPAYADLSNVFVCSTAGSVLYIDDILLQDGMGCEQFAFGTEYTLCAENQKELGKIEFIPLGNVSSVHIGTRSGKMDYIHEKKGNKEPGSLRIYDEKGNLDFEGELLSVEGRGNATWNHAKKPYNIELTAQADLLGMGEAENWILLANAYDGSNLNNKIAFDLAEKSGMVYVPDNAWVDLYLNGEYAGLYLLCEKIEIHPQRLNLSGSSFLVSSDLESRLQKKQDSYFVTENGMALRIRSAGIGQQELVQMWESVVNAAMSENGVDPGTGKRWDELIDVDSWVRRFLLDEILVNFDGGYLSQFFYWDQTAEDGKVFAGPVWDMDNCLARGEAYAKYPNAVIAHRAHFQGMDDVPLYYLLYQKPEFYHQMVEVYKTVYLELLQELLDTGMDAYKADIGQSALANQRRWKGPDWQESTRRIQTFLKDRISFLNDYWINNQPFYKVHMSCGLTQWACIAVRPGETAPEIYREYLDGWFADGWYDMETDAYYDFRQPVNGNITIYHKPTVQQAAEEDAVDPAREEHTGSTEGERLLVKAAPTAALSAVLLVLVFTEILRSKQSVGKR